jgi:hypothetical protein
MYYASTAARPDDAIDLSRIDWDIVVVGDSRSELIAPYRVTCWGRESGTFIGEAVGQRPATDRRPSRSPTSSS